MPLKSPPNAGTIAPSDVTPSEKSLAPASGDRRELRSAPAPCRCRAPSGSAKVAPTTQLATPARSHLPRDRSLITESGANSAAASGLAGSSGSIGKPASCAALKPASCGSPAKKRTAERVVELAARGAVQRRRDRVGGDPAAERIGAVDPERRPR